MGQRLEEAPASGSPGLGGLPGGQPCRNPALRYLPPGQEKCLLGKEPQECQLTRKLPRALVTRTTPSGASLPLSPARTKEASQGGPKQTP